jgi:transmembrane sensor
MSHDRAIDLQLFEEAARVISDEEEGRAAPDQSLSWLRTSPRHVGTTLGMVAVLDVARNLSPEARAELDASLGAPELDASLEVPEYDRPIIPVLRPVRHRPIQRMVAAGLTFAMLVAVFAAITYWLTPTPWQHYSTGVGKNLTVKLEDGSTLTLNTRSEAMVRMSRNEREVRLAAGEATFDVAHDPNRPFVVTAGAMKVEAVGTRFDVMHLVGYSGVVVASGVIKVSASSQTKPFQRVVRSGESIRFSPGRGVEELSATEKANALNWPNDRRLVFRNDTLAYIADEFNRYNKQKFVVLGEAATRRTSGVLNADSPDSLIDLLALDASLEIRRKDDEIIIRERRK